MIPLRAVDATWLNMDRADNPLVIDALLLLEAGADVGAVIDRFVQRVVLKYRRFRQVVVAAPGLARASAWKDADLNLDDHIHRVAIPQPAERHDLWATVGSLLHTRLDPAKPLWSLTELHGMASGQTVLLFRAHHVIGDGMAMAQVLLSVCDEDEIPMPRPRGHVHAPKGEWTDRIAADLDAGVHAMRATAELLSMAPDPPSPLSGPLSGTKRIAWSDAVPLSRVHAVRQEVGGTVNDVLVAAVSGALRQAVETVDLPDVRALMPVYLRPLGAPIPADLGNHFAPVFLRLPCSIAHPLDRLTAVRSVTEALKGGQMPLVSAAAVHAMGLAPRLVEAVAVDHFAARASLVLTNLPGPREAVHVAGARIDDMVFFVPQPVSIGVGLSLFSYNGNVRLGVSADVQRGLLPQRMAQAFSDELHSLYDAARTL